ncbi:MAG: FAD-dependent oxidoreductase [Hahellaceae bacterium]|nr:FAD-dependent oxidoreductase [Hahellaceae bacterium]
MKIAIIGAGVSGLTTAYYLNRHHDVTVFEANDYAGGHTDTHMVPIDGQVLAVDSGFIVFNEHNYPNFTHMLEQLGVAWQDTDMSFSAVNERSGLEYGAATLRRLFAQRRNLLSPTFYRMLWDIRRFYTDAPALLETTNDRLTLGEYLEQNAYSQTFIEDHILPMACALWSGSVTTILQFPARYFVAFMANHRMLQVNDRPQWRVVKGGSNQYVQAIQKVLGEHLRLGAPVTQVTRVRGGVQIESLRYGVESFDTVVFACHSDQALTLLNDPSEAETAILGSIPYQENRATLHTDIRHLPRHRDAWSSWNARIPVAGAERCTVSYWMNLLQSLPVKTPLIVTLNGDDTIDPSTVLATRTYHHPVYTAQTLVAQGRRGEINGARNTWFCGAYWGWGFHEDGVKSALDVVQGIEAGARDVAA